MARITVLARKGKTQEGLTVEEKAEQAALRADYVASVRANLEGQLENTYIQTPDGKKKKLKRKD